MHHTKSVSIILTLTELVSIVFSTLFIPRTFIIEIKIHGVFSREIGFQAIFVNEIDFNVFSFEEIDFESFELIKPFESSSHSTTSFKGSPLMSLSCRCFQWMNSVSLDFASRNLYFMVFHHCNQCPWKCYR